jgi:hypothetical protein
MLSKQVKARIKARKARRRHPKQRQLELKRRRVEAGVLKLQRNVVVGAHALPSGGFDHSGITESIKKSATLREQYRAADIRYYGRDRISKRYTGPMSAQMRLRHPQAPRHTAKLQQSGISGAHLQQRDIAQFGLGVPQFVQTLLATKSLS